MKKRTKKILFISSIIAFLVVTPVMLLYSWGYRFDFENKKITPTGSIYIKAKPKRVNIIIDGKIQKKTDLFFGASYIDSLIPKKHEIKIEKEGYHSWIKQLKVEPKQTTEVKHVILFPLQIEFNTISNNVEDFFEPLEGDDKLILKELPEKITENKNEINTDNDMKNIKENEKTKKEKEEKTYSLKVLDLRLNIKSNTTDLFSSPTSSEVLPTQSNSTSTNHQIIQNDIKNKLPYIFNKEEGVLYIKNQNNKSIEKIESEVKNVRISPSKNKLVYFSKYEVWILFLEDQKDQNKYKSNEKILLGRFSEEIKDAFWLNDDYVVLATGNKIKVMETDDRDKINIIDIAEFNNPKIFFSQKFNSLYVLTDKKLLVAKNFIP
jgi:archaellum component FlaG (FlaF/FlaG flagellin family)